MDLKKNNLKKGFTLLEVFLAIVVLSIAFSGVTLGIVNSRKNLLRARWRRMATEIAANELEIYRLAPPSSPLSDSSTYQMGNYIFDVQKEVSIQNKTEGSIDYQMWLIEIFVDHDEISTVNLHTEMKVN